MLRFFRLTALLGCLLISAAAQAVDIDPVEYGYPLHNPFEATIATTPPELRPELPDDADIDQADYSMQAAPGTANSTCRQLLAVKKLQLPAGESGSAGPADLHHCRHRRALREQQARSC